MAENAHTPSRRAMLAGLAAAPVAGLPAIAGVVSDLPLSQELAAAFARHKAACAAQEAACGPNDIPEEIGDEETEALWELAVAPCANDAELIVKLRYLLEYERGFVMGGEFELRTEGSLPIALEAHFNPERLS